MHTRITDEELLTKFITSLDIYPLTLKAAILRLNGCHERGLQDYSIEDDGLSWPPIKQDEEDFLYIFHHKTAGSLVYVQEDAEKLKYKLMDKGYRHTESLLASYFLEAILNDTTDKDKLNKIKSLTRPLGNPK